MADPKSGVGPVALCGRRAECGVFDGLLEAVREGRSGVLVVRGEAGIGKTALLEYVVASASGLRVVRAVGVESEMELAFAGLHQLCGPLLGRLGRLPGPQADALAIAFGLSAGPAPDRFLVGLAALGLISEAAEECPLVCVVDDAQWLDQASAQTLAFVARRLLAESVLMVFAARERGEELRGLPELVVEGLRDADARELLGSAVAWPSDERVRERFIAEFHGNPLALLELPRGLSYTELAGGFAFPHVLPLSERIEETFQHRLQALPADTQQLLLIAAAEPIGDPVLLLRAAAQVGVASQAREPAVQAELLEVGAQVRFRHPLVRSAAYRAASPGDRRKAHAALAEVTDPEVDPDRRAWHRAQATDGPDEDVAAELERAAGRAQERGGLTATAAFLQQAAELTPEPARRAQRSLTAAQAKHLAGAPDAALALLANAVAGPLDGLGRARADLLRGQIAFASPHGSDAPPQLLDAAKQLESIDMRLARETYLDALSAAMFVGRLADRISLSEVAMAARDAPPAPEPVRASDLLLDGLATLITEGYVAGTPIARRALSAFCDGQVTSDEELRWLFVASRCAHDLWDDRAWYALCCRQVQLARDTGALALLPLALNQRIGLHLHAGEFADAASLVEELDVVTEATGNKLPAYGAMAVAGWQGHEAEALELIDATMTKVASRGEGMGLGLAQYTRAVLQNGLEHYEDALAAAEQASAYPEELGFSNWSLAELIEAAVRSDRTVRTADALERLTRTTHPTGTAWGLGIEARSRALLSDGEEAERLYREAVDRLGHSDAAVALARAHLLYGEWLRREGRRLDAREQLRAAHEMFTRIGAEAFAARAGRELLATGERPRRRSAERHGDLTAQEAQIAGLARDGLSNPEIGARLFISPRTVEYHLHKVFNKLNIRSRNQLRHALPRQPFAAPAV